MCTVVFTFMCVRGVRARVARAWAHVLYRLGSSTTGQGAMYGVRRPSPTRTRSDVDRLRITIRPRAKMIYELRKRPPTHRRGIRYAAFIEERDAQLDRLDLLARPSSNGSLPGFR